ncbi:MAG: 4Fe-4S binding protein [Myxococcota bacterium]
MNSSRKNRFKKVVFAISLSWLLIALTPSFSSVAEESDEECPYHKAIREAEKAGAKDIEPPSVAAEQKRETAHSHHSTEPAHPTAVASHPCHDIQGIPRWLFLFGGAFVLVGTAGVAAVRKKVALASVEKESRLDILAIKPLGDLVKKPYFQILVQIPVLFLFALVLATGLFGSTYKNFAPVFTWTIWWGLLVFIVLFFGKAFCAVCPWDAVAGILQRFSLFKRRLPLLSRGLKLPKWARNIYPASLLFIGLTWLELGFGVTRNAPATAILGLLMLALTVISALVFERRSFCRYACLIGRISGLYAMFAPIELRRRNAHTCSSCLGKDCAVGNDKGMACPTFEFPARLERNTYCTLCTECVRACPHDNIGIYLRPFGEDLKNEATFRKDEAHLAVILLALTSFHGLTMIPTWFSLTDWVQEALDIGYKTAFSLLMALCVILPILLFLGVAKLSDIFTGRQKSAPLIFSAFAFPLVPIALFYHLAHNVMHFFREAQMLFPILSDPFGWGWNLFGTSGLDYQPLLSLDTIWYVQTFLILAGHIFGIILSERTARLLFQRKRDVWLAQIPMLIVMILFSLYSLWLIHQPMEMRTGM